MSSDRGLIVCPSREQRQHVWGMEGENDSEKRNLVWIESPSQAGGRNFYSGLPTTANVEIFSWRRMIPSHGFSAVSPIFMQWRNGKMTGRRAAWTFSVPRRCAFASVTLPPSPTHPRDGSLFQMFLVIFEGFWKRQRERDEPKDCQMMKKSRHSYEWDGRKNSRTVPPTSESKRNLKFNNQDKKKKKIHQQKHSPSLSISFDGLEQGVQGQTEHGERERSSSATTHAHPTGKRCVASIPSSN